MLDDIPTSHIFNVLKNPRWWPSWLPSWMTSQPSNAKPIINTLCCHHRLSLPIKGLLSQSLADYAQVNLSQPKYTQSFGSDGKIDHFRVNFCLFFKTSAKQFIWKLVSLACSFSRKSNSFSFEWFRTWTRFETEAKGNSEMAYSSHAKLSSGVMISDKFGFSITRVLVSQIAKARQHWSLPVSFGLPKDSH